MVKRELVDIGTDKRYVRRNKLDTSFVESDDVGRSLAADGGSVPKPKSNPAQVTKVTKRKAAGKGRSKSASRKGAARKPAGGKRAKRR